MRVHFVVWVGRCQPSIVPDIDLAFAAMLTRNDLQHLVELVLFEIKECIQVLCIIVAIDRELHIEFYTVRGGAQHECLVLCRVHVLVQRPIGTKAKLLKLEVKSRRQLRGIQQLRQKRQVLFAKCFVRLREVVDLFIHGMNCANLIDLLENCYRQNGVQEGKQTTPLVFIVYFAEGQGQPWHCWQSFLSRTVLEVNCLMLLNILLSIDLFDEALLPTSLSQFELEPFHLRIYFEKVCELLWEKATKLLGRGRRGLRVSCLLFHENVLKIKQRLIVLILVYIQCLVEKLVLFGGLCRAQ